ncbi:MAG: GCN5-related N-acetyltransferase [Verrucomicrobia bacterium]|nr:GCN5-related N-acetyltransferase [Verrucomicrobiota bacterium]
MTIRDAREADLPSIVSIYNSIIPGRMVTADLEPVTVAARLPWLQGHDPKRRPIWVAEDGERIVAWLSFDTFFPRAAYDGTVMIAVYVEESKRRSGLGRMLLARAIDCAPTFGIHTLLGYIFAHNEPSLRFFAEYGFERWAHLPRIAKLDGVERDLVIMGRRLTP